MQPSREIAWPDHECLSCGIVRSWQVHRAVDAQGLETSFFVCGVCGTRSELVAFAASASAHRSMASETEPSTSHTCEVCHAPGAKKHHWAPSFLFGSESERWPQSYLCSRCHTRWHEVVAAPSSAK
jgi:hypothetical protein